MKMTDEQINKLAREHLQVDDDGIVYGYVKFARAILSAAQADAAPSEPDDEAVDRFAVAMKEKMAAARAKGRYGWQFSHPAYLSKLLREHVEKGDPRDVANFCMMLWHHQATIAASGDQS
jgi:hypothetical protein